MKAVTVQPGDDGSIRLEEVPEPPESAGPVLLEPTTVVAKAWGVVAATPGRAFWEPGQVLVTCAGPIGMLAALIGVQHGPEVHVLDQVTFGDGDKPQLVRDLGTTYHSGSVPDLCFAPDVVVESTGVGGDRRAGSQGRCWRGDLPHRVGSGGWSLGHSAADAAEEVVLQNNVVVGSVNANRRLSRMMQIGRSPASD